MVKQFRDGFHDLLNWFVNKIISFLEKEKIPKGYAVNIFKDWAGCCGYLPLGVAIEIEGPNSHAIKDLDLKIYSKIIEIYEKEKISIMSVNHSKFSL